MTDDGRIVSDKGGYIFTNPLSRIFNCTVIITGIIHELDSK